MHRHSAGSASVEVQVQGVGVDVGEHGTKRPLSIPPVQQFAVQIPTAARSCSRTWRSEGPAHLFDPERNIAAGTAYMSWLLDRYHGDLDLALAGYNAGEGAVDKYAGIPPYRETQNYVRKVRAELAALQQSVLVSGL